MTLFVLATVTTLAAAIRSTWSPCGVSMLSTVTPLAEQGRGHRFSTTAAWFIGGSVVGGASLGLGLGLLARAFDLLALSLSVSLGVAAIAAALSAASDSRLFGWQLPGHRRQVNEDWLSRYRQSVYAVGFGWQIGVGVATYIVTPALYLMFVLAVLTGSPAIAVIIGAVFGLVRGLAILLAGRITTPERLVAFHRRFDALGEPVRWIVIGVQACVALVAVATAWGIAFAGVAIAVIAIAVVAIAVVAEPGRWRRTTAAVSPIVDAG